MNTRSFPAWPATAVALLGLSLHAYTSLFKAEGGPSLFTAGLLACSAAAYVLCLLVTHLGRGRPWLGFCGALPALVLDLNMYHAVFVSPASSTAAIGLLFAPLVNLFGCVPLGMLASYGLERCLRRARPR